MRRRDNRSGAAVTELAICLPVIFLLIFGSIQACNLVFLKQAVTAATYDTILVAMMPGATEADVDTRLNAIMAARNITGAVKVLEGKSSKPFANVQHGQELYLTVTVPTAPNIVGPAMFVGIPNIAVKLRCDKQ